MKDDIHISYVNLLYHPLTDIPRNRAKNAYVNAAWIIYLIIKNSHGYR